jgi:hypothetical protein
VVVSSGWYRFGTVRGSGAGVFRLMLAVLSIHRGRLADCGPDAERILPDGTPGTSVQTASSAADARKSRRGVLSSSGATHGAGASSTSVDAAELPSGFDDTVPLLVGADSGLASAVRLIGGVVDSRMRAEGGGHGVEMVADSSRAAVPGGSVHGDGPRRRDGVVTHGR